MAQADPPLADDPTAGSDPAVPPASSLTDRAAHSWRWCALVAGLAFLALVAVLTSAPGAYVGDNRFEQFWSPGRLLVRVPDLWDASRGLGRPRADAGLVATGFLALVRGLGASAWVAERLWHATLLTGAGAGAVWFLRSFRPGFGPEHAVAGLFYAFNPFSAVFLVPSGLFVNYAIAPWLLTACTRGSRRERPWRWAAVFALLLLTGATDPPGLFYDLVLLVPLVAYLVVVERTVTWQSWAAWMGRAAMLSAAVLAATAVQLVAGRAVLTARLFGTEAAAAVNSTSSWAESIRGLGFWVAYFPDGDQLLRPQHSAYVSSPAVVMATFVPAVTAALALGWARWRPRLLMGGLAIVSAALMVGAYPPKGPAPLGRFLLEAYEAVPLSQALRTSYKAGAGLALGVACLAGVGVAALGGSLLGGRSAGRARRRGAVPVVAALVIIAVVAFPFWTGRLYTPGRTMEAVPGYWSEAIRWLDRQPDEGRALVLPGTLRSRYRWGDPGDDIFDALLTRPHVVRTGLPQGTAEAADLVEVLDGRVQSRQYQPGTLGPVARRLGITYVVVRNDLDWRQLDRARPAQLQALRDDPDLEPAATFGPPGENVVAPGDASLEAQVEAALPPVEVFRVRDASSPVRALALGPPLLVSGNGEGWFQMAANGLLDDQAPIRSTAGTGTTELARHLDAGAQVVVTDTNRRRVGVVTDTGQTDSHTLVENEDLGRPAGDLFRRPGSQSTAYFPDAERITSTSTGASLSGFEPWFRPANAFDGDEASWWLTGGLVDPVGRSVKVDLRRPIEVSSVEVVAALPAEPGRVVTGATILFSDGTGVPADLTPGRTRATFPPRRTTSIEVRVDAVAGPGLGPVGFADVRVPSLDLAEVVQVPDDLARAAEANQSLEDRLGEAPVSFLFERARGDGPRDVEAVLRRRFRTVGDRQWTLDGALALGASTSDETLDALLGGPVGAYGTERYEGRLEHRGRMAVDGRFDTGWVAPARPGEALTVRFPERVVDRLEVTANRGAERSPVSQVRVTAGGVVSDLALSPSPECATGDGAPGCADRGVLQLPGLTTDRLTVEVTGVSPTAGDLPVEITEVALGPGVLGPATEQLETGCAAGVVAVDDEPVTVRALGPVEDLLAGRPASFRACDPVALDAGWHRLDGVALDQAMLASGAVSRRGALASRAGDPTVEVVSRTASRLRLRVTAPAGAVLVTGQSYDPGWAATAGGADLGPPRSLDTSTAWELPAVANTLVDVRYRPQRIYDVALLTTTAGIAACLWLAWGRPRPWARPRPTNGRLGGGGRRDSHDGAATARSWRSRWRDHASGSGGATRRRGGR